MSCFCVDRFWMGVAAVPLAFTAWLVLMFFRGYISAALAQRGQKPPQPPRG